MSHVSSSSIRTFTDMNGAPWRLKAKKRDWERIRAVSKSSMEPLKQILTMEGRKPKPFHFINTEGEHFCVLATPEMQGGTRIVSMQCLSFADCVTTFCDVLNTRQAEKEWQADLQKMEVFGAEKIDEESKEEVCLDPLYFSWGIVQLSDEVLLGMQGKRDRDHHIERALIKKCLDRLTSSKQSKIIRTASQTFEFHVKEADRILRLVIDYSRKRKTFSVRTAFYLTENQAKEPFGSNVLYQNWKLTQIPQID